MKILYVYEGKMNGHGLDLVADYQLRALSRMGCTVDFVSRGHVTLPGVRSRRVVLNPAKITSFLPSATYYAANRRWLGQVARGLLRRGRYDVVIGWQRASLPFFRLAATMGIPCILSSASSVAYKEPKPLRWLEWTAEELEEEYQLSRFILAPSQRTRDVYVAQGLAETKVRSIERGYDPATFHPSASRPSVFRVIFCGRVCERKGPRQLLEGWQRACLPGAELWFAGAVDGGLADWAQRSAGPGVKFFGFRHDVGDLMRQCTVHALLSSKESMGKSFIEAAACGLVNLSTADVGFPVVDGVNGLVVDRNDPAQIAAALRRLHDTPALCQQLADTSRREVEQTYTWDAFMTRFESAVRDSIA